MDAAVINKALYGHFANYEYKLSNTYLYDWESDFSAQSKSGYWIECEVKISKGDFRRDFEKPKHLLFRALMRKQTHLVHRKGKVDGDFLFRVRTGKLTCQYGPGSHKSLFYRSGADNPDNWHYDWRNQRFLVNDYGRVNLYWEEERVYAPACRVYIEPLEKINTPHQFYFACPKGLITVEELPPYAGLLWIREESYGARVEVIKRAPYMHKRVMDMRTQLLQKYYNLWQYKVSYEEKTRIRESYSEKEAGT
jgi:hypothetical protein